MSDSQKVTYLGKIDFRNKELPFGIKERDRTKHMYVIGKSGMGKSTLLENMAIQDIQNGEGLAFIDPIFWRLAILCRHTFADDYRDSRNICC
jgi:ATPase subunit of ABC transporter with duplicated ATPase domains